MFSYEITTDRWSSVVTMQYHTEDNKLVETRDVFVNPVHADKFVMAQLLAYMQRKLRNYVLHSRRIQQTSKCEYYNTPLFRKAMNVSYYIARNVEYHNLFSLAHMIRESAENLRTILPLESNPSYYSSHATLTELIRLAVKLQKQTQRTF